MIRSPIRKPLTTRASCRATLWGSRKGERRTGGYRLIPSYAVGRLRWARPIAPRRTRGRSRGSFPAITEHKMTPDRLRVKWRAPGLARAVASLRRAGIVPALGRLHPRAILGGTPGAGLVLRERRSVPQNGVHDAPGGLDRVFAREERRVAADGIPQESLVR